MVGARGFEPPTPWSRTRCATRLRYAPNLLPRATQDAKGHALRCIVPEAAAEWMLVSGMQSMGREAHRTTVPA